MPSKSLNRLVSPMLNEKTCQEFEQYMRHMFEDIKKSKSFPSEKALDPHMLSTVCFQVFQFLINSTRTPLNSLCSLPRDYTT